MKHCIAALLFSAFWLVSTSEGKTGAQGQTNGAAAHAPALRVCADPAGLPYSNDKKEGFENRIAALIANRLGAKVEYTWWVQRRGFLRHTLLAGACDVVVGVPSGLDSVRTTEPYYRSTYAFLTSKSRHLDDLTSIDDPRLRALKIGVPLAGDDGANPPPVHALGRRGITAGLRGFPLYGEFGRDLPAAAEALGKDEIDVAVLWGPLAGFAVQRSRVPLVAVPMAERSDDAIPLSFAIAMGVRKEDAELEKRLDAALAKTRDEITALLREAGVPLLPISNCTALDPSSLGSIHSSVNPELRSMGDGLVFGPHRPSGRAENKGQPRRAAGLGPSESCISFGEKP